MAKPRVTYEITAEDKSRRAVDSLEKRLKSAAKLGVTAVGTAAVAAAASVVVLSKRAAEAADNVGKLSLQLGIGVKSLSEYQFIAGQTGVKFETFTQALQRSTRRIAEAAQGTGEAQGALRELGLDAARLNQLDPGAQFEELSRALAEVTNQSDQVRLAFKLFDSEGVRVLRTINATGGAYDELRERARQLGAVVDEKLTKQAADVNDAMAEVSAALSGVGNTLLATFGPAIVEAAKDFTDFIVRARKAAEAIGLLDIRYTQLNLKELNLQWLENNRTLVAHERALKRIEDAGGTDVSRKQIIANLKAENEKIKEQIGLLREQKTELSTPVAGESAANPLTGLTDEELEASNERQRNAILSLANDVAQIEESLSRQRKAAEQDVATFKKQSSRAIASDFIGLLSILGRENKSFARAAIIVEKGLAIAQATINTAVAVTKALTIDPTGALAARVKAIGAVQIGLIGATGLAQISQLNSGGGIAGGGIAPAPGDVVTDTAPVTDLTSTRTTSSINISFNPGITDTEAVRTFITEDLAEALRDGAGLEVNLVAA